MCRFFRRGCNWGGAIVIDLAAEVVEDGVDVKLSIGWVRGDANPFADDWCRNHRHKSVVMYFLPEGWGRDSRS